MLGCIDCIMAGTACPNCDTVLLFELNTTTGQCQCQTGLVLDTDNVCKACWKFLMNCYTCISTEICTSCNLGFDLVGPTICQPRCGDGRLRHPEECDDGNTIAGDGCSAGCHIEADFTCDVMVEPSECSYAQPLVINNFTVLKDPTQNRLTFKLELGENW